MSSLSIRIPARELYADRVDGWWLWRTGEFVAALAALVALSPVLLFTCTAVALLSRRSPFVAHRRVGLDGEGFWMWKIRSMWGRNQPASGNGNWLVERIRTKGLPKQKRNGDPRVTSRLARFLRRYSVDELPQLAHVVSGRMSLVGPRPLVREELRAYYGPDAREVLRVRPGLTGLWQISGRSGLTYTERRQMDLHLVRRRSAWFYFRVLLRTLPVVAWGTNSW